MSRYEIQTKFSTGDGEAWHNCWTNFKTGQPQVFDSKAIAEKELREYLAACKLGVDDGDIMETNPDNYRITEHEVLL